MKKTIICLLILTLCSCGDVFQYHPYDVRISGNHHINTTNMERIERECLNKAEIRVAVISDSHGWLTTLKKAISHINARNDIDFIIHCGDLTDCATTKEFVASRDALLQLHQPWVALIGNHDFLGTGDEAYDYIFGEVDFSFIAGRTKFICLNTNATEYDYIAAVPNFDFMENEITSRDAEYDHSVVVMHAAPYTDQFNNNVAKSFGHYLQFFKQLHCVIYGHEHRLEQGDIYHNGLLFYGMDTTNHNNYAVFTFNQTGYTHETVYF